jgi:hypothetical protein
MTRIGEPLSGLIIIRQLSPGERGLTLVVVSQR